MEVRLFAVRLMMIGLIAMGWALVSPTAFAEEAADAAQSEEVAKDADAKDDSAKSEKKDDAKEEDEEESEEETLEEMVKDFDKIEGLFTFYRNTEDGGLVMEISEEQLAEGTSFIYHGVTLNGAAELGFRNIVNAYRYPMILHFTKSFDQIEIVQENTSFYFDPESPLAREPQANIQPALLGVVDVMAKSEDGTRYLVDADAIFQGEMLSQITPSMYPEQMQMNPNAFQPGGVNPEKTKVVSTKSFAHNSLVVVDYVFDNPAPTNYGQDDITNGRTVTLTFQHSLIATPEPGFEPRFDDQRVGYFTSRVTDLTSTSVTPYRDLINHWRLVKKDPDAALSEPVKPITFWIQNTTPLEYRDAIRDGTLAWNKAFEKAGFKNAVVVKIQPDDAEWDPADIDYNVIRYVSSPQPYYGGIGPSLPDPRTGEIIATDIVLENIYAYYRVLYTEVFDKAGMPFSMPARNGVDAAHMCQAGLHTQMQAAMALDALIARGASEAEKSDLVQQAMFELAVHEVGHTLGLMHNMKASSSIPYADIHSAEQKEKGYLTGSVMDYTATNIANDPEKQGLYYTVNVGPYDLWAIEFGYTPSLADPEAEKARVDALLSRSTEKALAFGNDADDMRGTYGGIDPRVMVDDLTDDSLQYAIDRFEYVDGHLPGLVERYSKDGTNWDGMRAAYMILTGNKGTQSRVIANYIGGVYLERADIGQDGAGIPYEPVEGARQRKAMEALSKYIYAPDAWDVPNDLIQHLQLKRRGYDQYGQQEPRVLDRVLVLQSISLDTILHPRNMQRMLDSTLYGNDYPPSEVLEDLTDAIFRADLRGSVNPYRRNLQLYYVDQLMMIATGQGGHAYSLQSDALYQLKRIEKMERQARSPDVATSAHRDHIRIWINQLLES